MPNMSTYLLAAIAITFAFQFLTAGTPDDVTAMFDFAPDLAFSQPWRFVTSMFLHGGLMHLFFNGYALLMFGSVLEQRVSRNEFLFIYFGAGLLGGFAYWLTYAIGMIPAIPAIGASGAIFGILGAVAVLMPDMRIFVWMFPMRMREAAIFWVAIEFLGTFDTSSGVASAAHLGGLFFGLVVGWWLSRRVQAYDWTSQPQDWQQPRY